MNPLRAVMLGSGQKGSIFALKRCFQLSAALRDDAHLPAKPSQPSLYDVLQIPQNSTHTEIRDAYYKLSKVYHPDVKKDENSLAMFRKITEAYDVLGNVRTRLEYDNKFLGKYQPYDTSKQEFYASIYRDQCEDGIRRPDMRKVLQNRSVIDEFMDNEYRDRLAEWRMYKQKLYEHYRIKEGTGGEFGDERHYFCMTVVIFYFIYKLTYTLEDSYSVW